MTTLPEGATIDDYLATLGKKERHEIRRKVRRAEAAGEVALVDSADPLADLEAFIDLHQKRWGVDGLFPDTPGGEQSRVFFRRLFELFGADDALELAFLTVGDRRIAAGISFETPDAILYYNAGVDPDARELSPGVLMVERYVRRALERGHPDARLPARRRAVQVRVGRGRPPDPAPARPTNGRAMTPEPAWDPCLSPVRRRPARGRDRIRVVQVMATGTNGGAQEHVYNLVTRMDAVALRRVGRLALAGLGRAQARAGRHRRHGDRRARRRRSRPRTLAAHLADVRADVIHNHMYRAEIVGTKAAIALGEAGHRRPWVISTVHCSRIRSDEDQEPAAPPHAVDRPPHRRLELDRPEGRRGGPDAPRRAR